MVGTINARGRSGRWSFWSFVRALMILSVLCVSLGRSTAEIGAPRLAPVLLELATRQPGQLVDVIVQKEGQGASAEALVRQLGGSVNANLWMINAFSASLPARALGLLARDSGVAWISPDAPTTKQALSEVSGWSCSGSYDGAESGSVASGSYALRLSAGAGSVTRCEQQVAVLASTSYMLSGSLKTSGISGYLGVRELPGVELSAAGAAFERKQLQFTTGPSMTSVTIYLEARNQAGQVYVDDVQLNRPASYSTPGALRLQYRIVDRNASNDRSIFAFKLTNSGATSVALSQLKLRYWLTRDGLDYLGYFCETNCAGVTSQLKLMPARANLADTYAEIGFNAQAGTLAPGAQSAEIQGRIVKTYGVGGYNERNDYSYDPQLGALGENPRLTLYQNGTLVFGAEPYNLLLNPGFEQADRGVNTLYRSTGNDGLQIRHSGVKGQGVTVAVVDSGITLNDDLRDPLTGQSRILASANFGDSATSDDEYGHGTHIAGIIGGNGSLSGGAVLGMAPKVNFVNVKFGDSSGRGRTSALIESLQWVYQHKDTYNIRVVNLSIASESDESYRTDPLCAAVEVLWFNNMVVVVAAGNKLDNHIYSPAKDPFVITVGSIDDKGSADASDDSMAPYTTYGWSNDGYLKPDILAHGTNIVSLLASANATVAQQHPSHLASGFGGSGRYYRMSGTSMSAAVVSGAVALMLSKDPSLTAAQVKQRLISSGQFVVAPAPFPGLDVEAAVNATATNSGNATYTLSSRITSPQDGITWTDLNYSDIDWTLRTWGTVDWSNIIAW